MASLRNCFTSRRRRNRRNLRWRMPSQTRNAPPEIMSGRIGVPTLFVVAAGAFALGGWVFRAKAPVATATASSQNADWKPTATAAPIHKNTPAVTGDQHELLAQL